MKTENMFKQIYNRFLKYTPPEQYNFFLTTENAKNIKKFKAILDYYNIHNSTIMCSSNGRFKFARLYF